MYGPTIVKFTLSTSVRVVVIVSVLQHIFQVHKQGISLLTLGELQWRRTMKHRYLDLVSCFIILKSNINQWLKIRVSPVSVPSNVFQTVH